MNHELPWYTLPVDKRYPPMVRPGYYPEGMVNFAFLDCHLKSGLHSWCYRENQACCYDLRHGHAVAFEFRMPTYAPPSRAAALQWVHFLTGKDSPWRAALQDIELVYSDGDPCGIIIKDCRVPRALLHNFFLAFRCAWEYRTDVAFFGKLVERGVPPQAAIYYAWTTICDGDKVSSWRSNGHTWMHSPYVNHPLMSRLFKLNSRFIPPVLFTESADDIDGQFLLSNHMWHEGASTHCVNPVTPPCLDEFESVDVKPKSVYNPKLEQQRQVPLDAFFKEVPDAWKRRLEVERKVAGHLI